MDPAGIAFSKGGAIDTWTTHCPECGEPVPVPEDGAAVACPACGTAFSAVHRATVHDGHPRAGAPEVDPLVGTSLGPWRLVRKIGEGGMGRVYEATDAPGRRRVAVKILSGELAADPAFVRRFHREARVLASLSHPHVVEVLDRGEQDGRLWFAMEYVRGENLRRRIHQGPLPPAEAVRIAGEIARALAYAHARGVVHRDLKPENVLLDDDGRVHLVDFGLSRLATNGGPEATTLLTRTDVILGTYEYMAPEQRRGERDLDGRADVYALGVLLYEMLTGVLPLGRFEPPSRVRPDVPEVLDPVVNRALAPERARRFASASSFGDAIDEAWARRRTSRSAPPRARSAPPEPVVLGEESLDALRSILRHVDLTAALDRVFGVLFLLAFVGVLGRSVLEGVFPMWPRVGGVLALIAAILLLRQGGRLSRMSQGAREGQITTSVLLLFLPPFGTALGVYGLVVFTSDRARRAFQVGRRALEGPRPVVASPVVRVEARAGRRAAPFWLHVLLLASLLWALYAGFLMLGPQPVAENLGTFWASMEPARQHAVRLSLVALAVATAVLVATFYRRRRRRGVGIAFVVFVVVLLSTWFLSGLYTVRHLTRAPRHPVPVEARPELPRSAFGFPPSPPPFLPR